MSVESYGDLDVLCVGHASFDLTMLMDHHPAADEKCFATDMISCGGGPAANAAVTVVRLGGQSALAAYLGEDFFGSRHVAELVDEGVRTDWIVRGSQPTPLSVILVKPNGNRSVINFKGATPPVEEIPFDPARMNPKAVLFDGHEPLISISVAREALARNIPTILDAGSVHKGTVDLLPLTRYLITSTRFSRDFTGESDPFRALERLSCHAPCTVITLGEKGLVWKREQEKGHVPAFTVDVVDTTGAGDAFHGAFSLGVARGMDFLSNLKVSAAAAALCCTRAGARLAIPTRWEVDALIDSQATRVWKER